MASDQTLPPVPLPLPLPPAAPNPDPSIPTAPIPLAADPTAPPPSSSAAARKLPVKRRSPPPRPSSPSSSSDLKHPHPQTQTQQPPFKFQRIWSESDELRFLQGLLGCGAQGMVFPRDLNVFYDRFSESMPQPYTRTQLSEKLRRLKNKFRGVSSRVGRGLDPARLAPHDRDVLHLCSRLWDPANASTSPFSTAAGTGAGDASSGNKRRRSASRAAAAGAAPLVLPAAPSGDSNSHDYNNGISNGGTPAVAFPVGNGGEEMIYLEQESRHFGYHGDAGIVADESLHGIVKEQPEALVALPNIGNIVVHNENGNGKAVVPSSDEHRMANAVLDIFEECLREVKANGGTCGVNVDGSAKDNELAKRWRAQRIDELDALSRRLRLLVEDAAAAGH